MALPGSGARAFIYALYIRDLVFILGQGFWPVRLSAQSPFRLPRAQSDCYGIIISPAWVCGNGNGGLKDPD
jgi:hypothetical protein